MWAILFGICCACSRTIAFNPHKVPSLMINGSREPLCRECAERWNELHPEMARPIMEGAYEHFPEEEL
jgi:hypothetical protein